MEGSSWLRLATIGALVLGSMYILAPSLLQDTSVRPDVAVEARHEPPLEAWYTVEGGSPDAATAAAVQARLQATGISIDRVSVDDEHVVVHLKPGTRKEDVDAAIQAPAASGPSVDLLAPAGVGLDVATLPAAGPERDAAVAAALATATVVEGASPVSGAAVVTEVDGGLQVASAAPAETPTPLVAVKAGVVVGWTDSANGAGALHLVGADEAAVKASVLAVGEAAALPVPVTRYVPPKAAEVTDVVEAPKAAWEAWLPDTKLALGLDLQGGIDLTLQVDQDAAVGAMLLRDRRMLQDDAAKEGKALEVRRDRTRDALLAEAGADESTQRDWVGTKLGASYAYTGIESVDGKSWQVWEMRRDAADQIREQAVEQNLETLRKRVDATGVKEPSIVKLSGGRINIQLPGVKDAQSATNAIGTQATLEFRLVDVDADENMVARYVAEAEKALPADQFEDVELLNDWLRQKGYVTNDQLVLFHYEETTPGKLERQGSVVVRDDVELTGADVDNASVGFDQSNIPRVLLDFKARGAARFCDITTQNTGKPFAIVLDNEVRSTPNIREPICGGSASIEMGSSTNAIDDANTLALVLRTGALTAPVDVGEVREIGASLGADAIRSGLKAAAIGFGIIAIFMAIWYRGAGLVADFALAANVLFVFAALAVFGATLTLPGIAGVALTVATSVDANIIIYERIREELKLGVAARKAVEAGFDKAFSAILDSNVTNAIAGVVLYSYGTGPIKGFAVTLLVGIATTLLSAVFVSRWLLQILTRRADARLSI